MILNERTSGSLVYIINTKEENIVVYNKSELNEVKMEIKSRKLVLKQLDGTLMRMRKQAEKQLQKRIDEVSAAREYKSVDEALDAWGWGFITSEEYETIKELMVTGEKHINEDISVQEIAVKILERFMDGLSSDIYYFEKELKSKLN